MLQATAPKLFESTATTRVLDDPANEAWLKVLSELHGAPWEEFRRRYHVALTHLRRHRQRPPLADYAPELFAGERREAKQSLLQKVYSGGPAHAPMFVPVGLGPERKAELPACLQDLSTPPPPLARVLEGPGRPPTDGLCLLRAFLGAIAMGLSDSPEDVHALLHRNPTFAEQCGFLGTGAPRVPGELTSRALPSESLLEEFDAVMTRYGLWHHLRVGQVRTNVSSGAVVLDEVLAFDTSHVEAASGCSSVRPPATDDDPKPKGRKVGRVHKCCGCGKDAWDDCPHPWEQTDPGAAVVVKGPTRNYWAHKTSIVSTGRTSIPLSVRVCSYAATPDGKTLPSHLDELAIELPQAIEAATIAVADAVYRGNKEATDQHGLALLVGITGRKAPARLAGAYPGIDRFTPAGVPVCEAGHAFEFRGRDLQRERFIWQAPSCTDGEPVCTGCSFASTCLLSGGRRRHLRVQRQDFPQIDWDHPQHQALHRATYAQRTGVERAIKRLKVDLGGEHLTRRGASRVQAHLDRRLLVLHLLLADDTS